MGPKKNSYRKGGRNRYDYGDETEEEDGSLMLNSNSNENAVSSNSSSSATTTNPRNGNSNGRAAGRAAAGAGAAEGVVNANGIFQNVVVSTLQPPTLQDAGRVELYLAFVNDYFQYSKKVGGNGIHIYNCLGANVLDALAEEDDNISANSTQDDVLEALSAVYRPMNRSAATGLLTRYKMSEAKRISRADIRSYIRNFKLLVEVCGDYAPPLKILCKHLLNGIQPVKVANYSRSNFGDSYDDLDQCGLYIATSAKELEGSYINIDAANNNYHSNSNSNDNGKLNGHQQQAGKSDKNNRNRGGSQSKSISKNSNDTKQGGHQTEQVCFGCGHSGHIRTECPHQKVKGYCVTGKCKIPLRLPMAPVVASDTAGTGNTADSTKAMAPITSSSNDSTNKTYTAGAVCNLGGLVASNLSNMNSSKSIPCTIGLDSYASFSIINPKLVAKLEKEYGVFAQLLDEPQPCTGVGAATVYISRVVDVVLQFTEGLTQPITVALRLGELDVPADILIKWGDVISLKLIPLMQHLAGTKADEAPVVASEEIFEDEYTATLGLGDGNTNVVVNEPSDNMPIISQASESLAKRFYEVCKEFSDVLDPELPEEGAALEHMEIKLTDSSKLPPHQGPRRQAPIIRKFINGEVDRLLQANHIRPSTSPVSSNVVVVKSGNRDMRLCIDTRIVNDHTVPLNFPLPNMKTIIDKAKNHKYYCILDLRKGYNQCMVREDCRYLTSFVTEEGQYEYNRIPFGLRNGPSWFQKAISSNVLAGLVDIICLVYIDDVLIFGDTEDEIINNCRKVLLRFRKYKLRVKANKCMLGFEKVKYLGYELSGEGYSITQERKDVLKTLRSPTTRKELRSFIGFMNTFREFIPGYVTKMVPITSLLSPKKEYVWTDVQQEAYNRIMEDAANTTQLHHFDPTWTTVVRTDASTLGCGGVLLQRKGNLERVIAYFGHKFSDQATRWSTIEQEAYSIFRMICTWEYYLTGIHFLIETDHLNLVYIDKATSGKVQRWRSKLLEFDFTIVHIPGRSNVVPDYISRFILALVSNRAGDNTNNSNDDDDDDVPPLLPIGVASDNEDLEDEDMKSYPYSITDEHREIIRSIHNAYEGHGGVGSVITRLKSLGHNWKHMRSDVVYYIHHCAECQKQRETSHVVNNVAGKCIEQYEPFEEVCLDNIGPLPEDDDGNKYIIGCVDVFSKTLEAKATTENTCINAAKFLLEVWCRYGPINHIRSDLGVEFTGNVISELVKLLGTDHKFTLAYKHSANLKEPSNQQQMRHLKHLVLSDPKLLKNWSNGLPMAVRIVNNTVHTATGVKPYSMLYGGMINMDRGIFDNFTSNSSSVISTSYVQELKQAQQAMINQAQINFAKRVDREIGSNTISNGISFSVGDYVLVNYPERPPHKLASKWFGPMLVTEISGNTLTCSDLRYRSKLLQYDVSRCKLYLQDITGLSPLQVAMKDENEDVVIAILEHKQTGKVGNKKSLDFYVEFTSGIKLWLPYMECRELTLLDEYSQKHPELKL